MTLAEMAARAAESGGRIVCTKCGCTDFRTYKTSRGVASIVRYKACRHCGRKVLTTSQTNERVIREISTEETDADDDFENDIL